MRIALIVVALAFFTTLLVKRPAAMVEASGDIFRVGLVFDVGGLGDKSFNDSAYRGLLRAQRELGVAVTEIEPGDGSDRAAALRMLAASGHAVVIAVGFIFTDDVLRVAADYPKVSFACVDMALRQELLPNIVALKFREEEGSFLAGVLAAEVSQSKALGFVGGMDIPLIHKFSAGFRAGIRAHCPECKLAVLFAGATPNAFKDPAKGREMALSQYQNGADVVFHAAGATGLGVFQAAREMGKLAIGVDSDQSEEGREVVLTSMVKRVDRAVFEAVREAKTGTLTGGVRWLGLKEDGLELAINAHNEKWFTPERKALLTKWQDRIVKREIEVPDHD